MQDVIEQLLGYLRGIWRQRWYALLMAWLLCIGGWAFVLQLPDEYEAAAKVQVDTSSILVPLLRDMAVQGSSTLAQLRQMQETILSRPNLEKVMRDADIDLEARDEAEQEELLKSVQKNLQFSRTSDEGLYTIKFRDPDPNRARKVVQALLNLFIEQTLGGSRQDTAEAQRFLDRQIEEYKVRLDEADARLREFKRKNIGMMPDQGRDYYQRMQEAQRQLDEAELEMRQAENLSNELKRQLAGEEPSFGMVQSAPTAAAVPELDSRIAAIQKQLDDLTVRYTEKHPDVVNARTRLKELQDQRQEILKAGGGSSMVGVESNPVYQQLRISSGEAEARLAALRVKVTDYRARVQDLEKRVYVLPQIEEELRQLNRDYTVTKDNYDRFVAKREQARISQDREENTSAINFRVIESPRVPPTPVGPNRVLFLSGVLAAGLGAGVAVAFLISQILSTFDNPKQLMQALQVPVLGTVSLVLSPRAERMRKIKNLIFLCLGVALLPVYGALLYLQTAGRGLFGQ